MYAPRFIYLQLLFPDPVVVVVDPSTRIPLDPVVVVEDLEVKREGKVYFESEWVIIIIIFIIDFFIVVYCNYCCCWL